MTLRSLPFFMLLKKCVKVAVFLLVSLGGCNKVEFKVKKATEYSQYAPYASLAPLTIRGVWPGQNRSEVISLLGPPDRRIAPEYGPERLQWERSKEMAVTLDKSGARVAEVVGGVLTSGDAAVIETGMSDEDVQVVLGKPVRDQVHTRPSSDLINLRSVRWGRTFWYRRDERTIEISVQERGVAYVRLTLPPP